MIEAIIVGILYGVFAGCMVLLVVCILALIKNEITFKHHMLICTAIYEYAIDVGTSSEPAVWYNDMESYDDTFRRWWDWGYTRILPPEKFEILKPYILEVKEMRRNKKNG